MDRIFLSVVFASILVLVLAIASIGQPPEGLKEFDVAHIARQ
jgi:hypothetical protein